MRYVFYLACARLRIRARHAVNTQVLGCCFEADGGVVTCGEKHALFWKKEGRCLVKKKGVFGRKATAQMLLCCSSLKGKVSALVLGCGSEWGECRARVLLMRGR